MIINLPSFIFPSKFFLILIISQENTIPGITTIIFPPSKIKYRIIQDILENYRGKTLWWNKHVDRAFVYCTCYVYFFVKLSMILLFLARIERVCLTCTCMRYLKNRKKGKTRRFVVNNSWKTMISRIIIDYL